MTTLGYIYIVLGLGAASVLSVIIGMVWLLWSLHRG